MDSEWSLWRFLVGAYEALCGRKTFMNVDPALHHYLYCVIILFKSCVAAYGMNHVVPKKITYPFLCVQFLLHFVLRDDWWFVYREMFNLITHVSIIEAIEGYQIYNPSVPNMLVWYYHCSFNPSEFFLDVYVIVVVSYAIWKSYRTRPHKLSTMMCVLFTVNWVTEYFSSAPPTDTFTNMIYFYVPQLILDSTSEDDELHALPQALGSVWVCLKLARTDLLKSPAGRFMDSLNIADWTFTDYLDAVGKRKSFLNVDYREHFVMFYVLLLLKSVLASYSVRHLVGVFPTLKLLYVNFLFSLCERSLYALLSGFVRLVFLGGYQYILHITNLPVAISSGIWYFVGLENQFHFLLDFYLMVSVFVYIDNAYRGTERIYSLLWFLYLVDWFADVFVGRHFSTIATMATLYLPVALITSCTKLSPRTRIVSMLVFIALWLVYKQEKEMFDYAVGEYILNLYELSKTLLKSIRATLSK